MENRGIAIEKEKERLGRMFGLIVCMSLFMTTGSMGEVQASGTDPSGLDSRVFQVIFPGDTEHIFDFIMDPQADQPDGRCRVWWQCV